MQPRLIVLLTIIFMLIYAPALTAQDDSPGGNSALAFMIGEWAVVSERNLTAYQTQEPAPDAAWQTSDGVARIESLMHHTALLERYTSTANGQLYAQTVFLGTRNNGRQWDAASTDNLINALFSLRGGFDAGIFTVVQGRANNAYPWQIIIEPVDADAFDWHLYLLPRDSDPVRIWTKHYTRLAAGSYAERSAGRRSAYPAPPAPDEMADFHFWLGLWQVDHHRFDDVIDRIELASGGHAMIEFWQVQHIEDPPEFFTMTIWDKDLGGYHNWLWARLGATQDYRGGTCEGEGPDKQCRLAGVFYNITDESVDWRFNGVEWRFNRLEYPQAG